MGEGHEGGHIGHDSYAPESVVGTHHGLESAGRGKVLKAHY